MMEILKRIEFQCIPAVFFKCAVWVFCLASIHYNSIAQSETPIINADNALVPIKIFRTPIDSLNANDFISSFNERDFIPLESLGRSRPNDVYWVKLDFENLSLESSEDQLWHLTGFTSERSKLYYQSNTQIKSRDFGFLIPLSEHKPTIVYHSIHFRKSELIQDRYLYMRLEMLAVSRDMSSFRVRLLSDESAKNEALKRQVRLIKGRTGNLIFVGIVMIVFLFSAYTYITQRKKEYLFYCLYLFSLAFYLGRRSLGWHDSLFGHNPLLEYIAHIEFQILINLFYTLFARYFLNTAKRYKVLDKFIKWVVVGLIALIFIDLLLIGISEYSAHLILMDVQRYVMATFGIVASIYLLIRAKSPLAYFIVAGSTAYTLGALATLFLWTNDFMIAGSALEVFIFTMGLGYKNRHLIIKNAQIERQAMQLKMSALRAQMNPHFIFNSLGSIQHLIRSEKKADALLYLSKFSKLLRQVLETSINVQVTLKEEIGLLKNYIELESLRFDGQFSYDIRVDDSVDVENFEIPILLLQPHVENAIIHGLLPKEGKADLLIHFKAEPEHVVCIVQDNGIGRIKSAERKIGGQIEHKSRGLSIVENRLNELDSEGESSILVEDLYDSSGEAIGTKVSVWIPKEE